MTEISDFLVVMGTAAFISFILSILYLMSHSRAVVSRKMAIALIVFSMIAAMMLYLKFTRAGLIVFGALTIMRIREPLKDHRDTAFVFLAVVTGFCCASHQFYLIGIGYTVLILILFLTGSLRMYDRIILVVRGDGNKEETILENVKKKASDKLSLIYNNSVEGKYTELIYEISSKVTDKYDFGRSMRKMLFDAELANEVNIVNQRDDMKI